MDLVAGRDEIIHVGSLVAPGHPWPAITLAAAIDFHQGASLRRDDGTAVAWHGGNPWGASSSTLHVLGDPKPAADLIDALATPGGRIITTPEILATVTSTERYDWDLRTVTAPIPPDTTTPAGFTPVTWLPAAPETIREIDELLDEAFDHASLRPDDPRAGRWCGVRDARGTLVACGAETLPVAPTAHLSALAVLPRARRAGLGATITRFFVAESFAAGAPQVVLAVDADNVNASALYDGLGFSTWHLAGATLPTLPTHVP